MKIDRLLLLFTVVPTPIVAAWMQAPAQYRPDALDALVGFGIWTLVAGAIGLGAALRQHRETLRSA